MIIRDEDRIDVESTDMMLSRQMSGMKRMIAEVDLDRLSPGHAVRSKLD